MSKVKYLFIDRDGTLIVEPIDKQIDSTKKLEFMPGVFSSLEKLIQFGFKLIMVSNQDGLGTERFRRETFEEPHQLMLKTFKSQAIAFDDIKICPHMPDKNCECRKPKVGLLMDYLKNQTIDLENSFVIGDRESDAQLAKNLGIRSILINTPAFNNWNDIASYLIEKPREITLSRKTAETEINLTLNLDQTGTINIDTGISFFNHMLEQFAKHAGFSITLNAIGDINVDDHHTVEDVAIVLGEGVQKALGDKIGIARYGFLLPMDESLSQTAIDLSGRAYSHFNANFKREQVGDLSTELVEHFFSSFTTGLRAAIHIDIHGDNTHHMIESAFKSLGRALRQAVKRESFELPTTKGLL